MKQLIEWSTPKYIKIKELKQYRSIPGKRKWSCKKSKGEHHFKFIDTSSFDFGTSKYSWDNYQCIVCGKKDEIFRSI
ncbi:hypothetical protein HYT02_03745 [Candidatus Gottesmanbacteria bacterium]|nr:hypothetical protein [Candidatus Gottesmanbacteria bacterium]